MDQRAASSACPMAETPSSPCGLLTICTHVLMLLSMALYAGNYVFFRIFNEHGHSAFLFSLLRTLMSIAFLPLVYFLDPKNYPSSYKSTLAPTRTIAAYAPLPGRGAEDAGTPSSAVNGFEYEKRLSLIHTGESEADLSEMRKEAYEGAERFQPLCTRGICANMAVKREAVFPLLMASLSGAVRQMIVPVALMFTSAENAGIIQPSVPVFTAFLAVILGLETGGVLTYCAVGLVAVGLFVAGQAWNIHALDRGFLLLLLVPVSKGLQVIGLQYASQHERASVLQLYQIIGLILFIIPVATILELALYCRWSFRVMLSFVAELDAISWGAVVYSAVSIILVCWRIQILGVQVIGSVGVALYQAFQPVFAFILGWGILGEPIVWIQIVGAAVVCIALVLYEVGQVFERRWAKEAADRERCDGFKPLDTDDQKGLQEKLL